MRKVIYTNNKEDVRGRFFCPGYIGDNPQDYIWSFSIETQQRNHYAIQHLNYQNQKLKMSNTFSHASVYPDILTKHLGPFKYVYQNIQKML